VAIRRDELEPLLAALITIDSRNPWLIPGAPGEAMIGVFLADRFAGLDVEVAIDEVAAGRQNVVVRWQGAGGGPSLCLNAHIDTVGHASWPGRALQPRVEGDRMIGLGAADDKGHVAVIALLLESLLRSGSRLRGDLVLAFTADEEAISLGTQDLVGRHRTDAAIVVEPFGLGRALVTHQGFGWLDIVVHGRAAHGSAPDDGIDAISHAALILRRLDALGARWAADPHPLNGATVYHASTIAGGSDYATYPASCTLGIEIGTQPGESISDRVREIEAIVASIRDDVPDFDASVIVRLDRDPFAAAGHEALWAAAAAATHAVTGRHLEAAGENAWMDAALMQAAGIPTISLGASGGGLHAADEWVALDELVTLGAILDETVRDFCMMA
jgi:acetylornithine deacetylase